MFWVKGPGTYAERAAEGPLAALARRTRRSMSRRLGIGIGPGAEAAAICRAILLGDRSGIEGGLRREFAAAGTVHVLKDGRFKASFGASGGVGEVSQQYLRAME